MDQVVHTEVMGIYPGTAAAIVLKRDILILVVKHSGHVRIRPTFDKKIN
jgi:hypothetical protein